MPTKIRTAPPPSDPAHVAAGLGEAIGAVSAAATADGATVLETLARQAEALLGCDAVDVHLIEEPGDRPVFRRARLSARARELGGVVGSTWRADDRHKRVLRSGSVSFYEDFQAHITDAGRAKWPWLAEPASAIYVPIWNGDRIVGLLDAHWVRPRREEPHLVQVADALARCAGAALTVAQLYETARASAEAAAAGEERLRLLVEKVSEAIFLTDETGRVTYTSSSIESVLGYRPDELIGQSLFQLTHPDEMERARRGFARLVERPGYTSVARWRARHKDGSWRWVEGSERNLLDEPSVAGILLSYRDVTERHQMDEVLAELAQGMSAAVGEDFFRSVGLFLARNLGVSHVVIGELRPDVSSMRTVALVVDGELRDGTGYALAGTASASVVGGEPRVVRQGAQREFPDDPDLATHGIDSWVGVPLFTRGGTPLGVLAVMDRRPLWQPNHTLAVLNLVAKRVEAELERRASEGRFRAVVEQSWEGIAFFDAEMRPIYASQAYLRLFGETSETWADNVFKLAENLHPAERAAWLLDIARVRSTPGARQVSVGRRRHADGSYVWVEGSLTNMLEVPGVNALVLNVRDVTPKVEAQEALRASEERYRTIVETSQEGVWILDAEDRTSFANARMAELLGTTVDDLVRRPIGDYVAAEDQAAHRVLLARRREGIREQFEFRFRRPDGRDLWALVAANPLTDAEGTYVGALAMVMDVGERRTAEEALRAAERRAAQQEKLRSLGQMASGIAHDLNQALSLIAGYGEVARAALAEPTIDREFAREAVDRTVEAAVTGGQTLKRLLTFARPTVDAPPVEIRVGDLLREVADLTAPRWRDATAAEGRPIAVTVEVDPEAVVLAPAPQLREALINLIFNAVDAMPGGGAIELRGRRAGTQVVLVVADDGVGMTPDVRARVFEPFFTTKGDGGTGLGLPQVRALVEQLDGDVELESEVGRGTTVRLRLPSALQSAAGPSDGQKPPCGRTGSHRILFVEDHADLATAATLMLRKHGHEVRQVTTGEAALVEMAEWRPDVVLSDLSLGSGMNGWELANQVRTRAGDVRFVLATGWGAQIEPATARASGVDAVVAKPYTIASLLEALSAD